MHRVFTDHCASCSDKVRNLLESRDSFPANQIQYKLDFTQNYNPPHMAYYHYLVKLMIN